MRPSKVRLGVLVGAATLAATAGATVAGGGAGAAVRPKAPNLAGVTLRIGDLGGQSELLLKASGALRGTKYKVSWSVFPAGPQAVSALQGGSIDLTLTADTPALFAQAGHVPLKVLAVASPVDPGAEVGIVATKSSGITNVSQLKGKSVATTSGTILQYLAIRALNESGVGYGNVKIDNLAPTLALSAFQSGSVQAATLIQPYLALAQVEDGGRLLESGKGITAGYSYFLASDKVLTNSNTTAALADYLKRYAQAEAWAAKHPSTWALDYATANKLPLGVSKTITAGLLTTFVPISKSVEVSQQEQANVFTDIKALPSALNVTSEYDTRFNSLVTSFAKG
ncbi:MAG: aliphatic sulfonates family transporter, periplasmic ligand-binding protein [Acidimicrobiaceae bacterium]|nr:aliphatic sulfonates family transporter, periplasmic ligand-binding protein [Acidimicrobiaceae bacterium]